MNDTLEDESLALALQLSLGDFDSEDDALAKELQESEYLRYQYELSRPKKQDPYCKVEIISQNDLAMSYYFNTDGNPRTSYDKDYFSKEFGDYDDEDADDNDFSVLNVKPSFSSNKENGRLSKYNYANALKDRASKLSVPESFDDKTKLAIQKLIKRNLIDDWHGTISQGKEASVYLTSHNGVFNALKVFKRHNMPTKDRAEFVKGDWRYRFCLNHLNKQKLFKIFPEKEIRNLKRVQKSSIPSPEPIFQEDNIILMSYIGSETEKANVLASMKRDIDLDIYYQCIMILRSLYLDCRLVHTDANAYNFLYYDGVVHMIDFSQAVDYNHPNALYFLRQDCYSITSFFMKRRVQVLTLTELFKFVTDKKIQSDDIDSYIDSAQERSKKERSRVNFETEEQVFLNSFIPRSLSDLKDPYVEVEEIKGGKKKAYYFTLEEIESN